MVANMEKQMMASQNILKKSERESVDRFENSSKSDVPFGEMTSGFHNMRESMYRRFFETNFEEIVFRFNHPF
jgi:hypothetical protein